jgi:3-isopropylmalate dehydrogenase
MHITIKNYPEMNFKIAVLPGDGIGPEISAQGVLVMKKVCERFGHTVEFKYGLVGADAIDKVGNPFPDETYELCRDSDAVLFSAVGDPKFDNNPEAKVRPEQGLLAMRKKLGLYANIRPVTTFACLLDKSPLRADIIRDADFVCIRELTGGMYFGEKHEGTDEAWDTNYYTRREVERILRVGYDYARRRKKHLTVVDKANVLASSRLWRKVAQEMSAEYPDVTTDYMYVDNAAMRMIQDPRFFDVMVTENTFGDILTDEGSVITGSMGLLPSASTGESTPVFEPIHGSWPQAKGLNIANPIAQILSVAMLFEYFNLMEEGAAIRNAVQASLDAGFTTPDLSAPGHHTDEVGAWIAEHI